MVRLAVFALLASACGTPAQPVDLAPEPDCVAPAVAPVRTPPVPAPVVTAPAPSKALAPLPAVADRPASAETLRRSRALLAGAQAMIEQWRAIESDAERAAKIEQAVGELRRAIAAEPANLDAWFTLGDLYSELEQLVGATEVANALATSGCDACVAYLYRATT